MSNTTNEKGDRNEREAADILGRVYGKGNVDKVDAYSNTDPLGFVDVLAAKDPWPVRFVQVKTNRFPPKQQLEYAATVDKFDESVTPEVWVRVDRDGWRMYEFVGEPDEWNCYLEMDTCDYEETVEAFREAVGFYGGGT
ncbi:hypothetical protein [Natrinema ejinorense]|uniref:PD(D/E)XK endonuclease domain-containing protein n=1 Tax=Natrinema ejinorense TaxID=373386 RepID=A0A2A5QPA5_9EURY|nr:hypothetical protein [Natrinema ejinorense]PCR88639.1 hypothetical protein CP557_21640 [Natrinema ejinorense]